MKPSSPFAWRSSLAACIALLCSATMVAAADDKKDLSGISPTIERVKVKVGESPSIGPQDAAVTLIEFIDYQCGFCARAHKTVDQVLAKYPGQVRVVFKQHPLSFHKDAPLAARAALAADIQGQFVDMHNILLENTKKLKRHDILLYATQLGLDIADFRSMVDSDALKDQVKTDTDAAQRIGATGTPFFLVNGRPLRGAQPLDIFSKVIDEELSGDLRPTKWIERVQRPPRRRKHDHDHDHDHDHAHGQGGGGNQAAVNRQLVQQLTALNRELRTLRQELSQLRNEVRGLRSELSKDAQASKQ